MTTSFINGPLIIMPSSLAHCIAPLWGLFHCLKSENERKFSYDFFVMVLWNIQYIRPTILSSTTGNLSTSCSFGIPILFCNKFEVIIGPVCWYIIEKFIQGLDSLQNSFRPDVCNRIINGNKDDQILDLTFWVFMNSSVKSSLVDLDWALFTFLVP